MDKNIGTIITVVVLIVVGFALFHTMGNGGCCSMHHMQH